MRGLGDAMLSGFTARSQRLNGKEGCIETHPLHDRPRGGNRWMGRRRALALINATPWSITAEFRRYRFVGPAHQWNVPLINRYLKPETRYARRMARIARWDKPLAGGLDRVRAWLHMLLADHGVFRVLYLNKHRVSEKLWRSAQPAPHQIARLKEQGIRTIVNLRGGREHGSWQLQKDICDRLGHHACGIRGQVARRA